MQPIRIARTGALLTALVLAGGGAAQAQTGYLRPPDPVPAIVTAGPMPTVMVGRDRRTLALLTRGPPLHRRGNRRQVNFAPRFGAPVFRTTPRP